MERCTRLAAIALASSQARDLFAVAESERELAASAPKIAIATPGDLTESVGDAKPRKQPLSEAEAHEQMANHFEGKCTTEMAKLFAHVQALYGEVTASKAARR